MRFLKYSSLRFKIIAIMLIVIALIIGIGFSFVIINNVKTMKANMLENTIMNTRLIGEYCVSPLIFDDKSSAEEILQRLNTIPNVVGAKLYDSQNSLFASFSKDSVELEYPNFKKGNYNCFEDGFLCVCESIIYKKTKYGAVFLKASTKLLEDEITNHLFTMIILISILFVIAIVLTQWFQTIISSPILKLAGIMEKISQDKDYSIRIENESNDEIGLLYKGFNNMLEQIQRREKERDKAKRNMQKAKEKAEESDKLKSAFLANMSHEIRTPMNAIIGFAQLLSDRTLTDDRKSNYIKYINKSSNTLLALVNDIIDLSKIEASQLSVNLSRCDVNSALLELFNTFDEIKLSYYDSNIELKYIALNHDVVIETDTVRFKQVVTNLLSNALKFTEEGFVEFSGYIENDNLIVYVKDTGIGMTPEQLEVIFDRFRKVSNADAEKLYRGAGLGLAISKSLVSILNGRIWVKSELGKGTTFYVSLPYTKNGGDV